MTQVTNHFYYREICDDTKMELFFWRTLDKYRDRFLKLAGFQTVKFDPMVNKYLESEHDDTRTSTINRKNNSTDKLTGKHSDKQNSESYSDNENIQHDNRILTAAGTTQGTSSNTENIADNTRNMESENTAGNRIISNNSEGESSNIAYNNSMNKNTGTGTTTTDSLADTVAKQASKAAPMNASGLTNTLPGENSDLAPTEHLGGLSFEYASAYQQADTLGKTTSNVNNNSTSEDNSASNSADQKTYTDTKEETEKSGGERTKLNAIQNYNQKAGNTADERTDSKTENTAGQTAGHSTGHDKNIADNTYNIDDTHNIEGSESNESTSNGLIHLRYTGRDGLTPYEALRGAENYLRDLGPAIDYLIKKLETCFIGVYDI